MSKQLELVLTVERDKEESLIRHLQEAQAHLNANQQKLQGLQKYRNEYMESLHLKGVEGVAGKNYQHFQQFINKLEQACQQQHQVVATAKQVVEQRRKIWLEQHQRTRAVQYLIDKQQQQLLKKQQIAEQKLMDELVLNRLVRQQGIA